jgi:hypothetical protein
MAGVARLFLQPQKAKPPRAPTIETGPTGDFSRAFLDRAM